MVTQAGSDAVHQSLLVGMVAFAAEADASTVSDLAGSAIGPHSGASRQADVNA